MIFQPNQINIGDGGELLKSLPDNSVGCAFFDPQYASILDYLKYGNPGEQRRRDLPQQSNDQIIDFMLEIERVLQPNRYLFLWIDLFTLVQGIYNQWLLPVPSLKPVDMITWHKQVLGWGYRTRKTSEFLLVVQKSPRKSIKQNWTDRAIPNVWTEKRDNRKHPHAKPIELQSRLIAATTESGDLIVDPCAGSYSVLKACKRIGRDFLGCDLL